jgi:hypothetical protein
VIISGPSRVIANPSRLLATWEKARRTDGVAQATEGGLAGRCDLKARGMRAAALAIDDGALGADVPRLLIHFRLPGHPLEAYSVDQPD